MGNYTCPRCRNKLDTIKESVGSGGYFTFWECPVCKWNNRSERKRNGGNDVGW